MTNFVIIRHPMQMYRYIDIDTYIDRYIGRQIDRAATFFCPCTKDYIFSPMDDDI